MSKNHKRFIYQKKKKEENYGRKPLSVGTYAETCPVFFLLRTRTITAQNKAQSPF